MSQFSKSFNINLKTLGDSSDVLLEATDLPILSDSDCSVSGVEALWKVSPDMVCAGGRDGKDSCQVGSFYIRFP